MMTEAEPEKEIAVRDLYPELREDQLKEAEENLNRYIDHCLRVFERLVRNPEAYAGFRKLLTEEKQVDYPAEAAE